jgi:hypothetical protein
MFVKMMNVPTSGTRKIFWNNRFIEMWVVFVFKKYFTDSRHKFQILYLPESSNILTIGVVIKLLSDNL